MSGPDIILHYHVKKCACCTSISCIELGTCESVCFFICCLTASSVKIPACCEKNRALQLKWNLLSIKIKIQAKFCQQVTQIFYPVCESTLNMNIHVYL